MAVVPAVKQTKLEQTKQELGLYRFSQPSSDNVLIGQEEGLNQMNIARQEDLENAARMTFARPEDLRATGGRTLAPNISTRFGAATAIPIPGAFGGQSYISRRGVTEYNPIEQPSFKELGREPATREQLVSLASPEDLKQKPLNAADRFLQTTRSFGSKLREAAYKGALRGEQNIREAAPQNVFGSFLAEATFIPSASRIGRPYLASQPNEQSEYLKSQRKAAAISGVETIAGLGIGYGIVYGLGKVGKFAYAASSSEVQGVINKATNAFVKKADKLAERAFELGLPRGISYNVESKTIANIPFYKAENVERFQIIGKTTGTSRIFGVPVARETAGFGGIVEAEKVPYAKAYADIEAYRDFLVPGKYGRGLTELPQDLTGVSIKEQTGIFNLKEGKINPLFRLEAKGSAIPLNELQSFGVSVGKLTPVAKGVKPRFVGGLGITTKGSEGFYQGRPIGTFFTSEGRGFEFARAGGRLKKEFPLTDITLRLEKQAAKPSAIFRPAGIKKTLWEKTFPQQILQEVKPAKQTAFTTLSEQQSKQIVRQSLEKSTQKYLSNLGVKTLNLQATSVAGGFGNYLTAPKPSRKQAQLQIPMLANIEKNIQLQIPRLAGGQLQGITNLQIQQPLQIPRQAQIPRQLTELVPIQTTIQTQIQLQIPRTAQIQRQTFETPFTFRTPLFPFTPIIPFPRMPLFSAIGEGELTRGKAGRALERYQASLLGLISNKRVSRQPKILSGIEIRYPVGVSARLPGRRKRNRPLYLLNRGKASKTIEGIYRQFLTRTRRRG